MRSSDHRNILTQNQFEQRESFITRRLTRTNLTPVKSLSCKKFLLETFPFIEWMSEYKIKRDLPMDLMAGLTVTVLQIPQGIAYGFLANVPSICGLYTAFFTSFVYVFFGTSRHTNFGTFAVVCLMVGQTVTSYSTLDEYGVELRSHEDTSKTGGNYTNIEVSCAITFTVAVYLLLMYCLRLGIITTILSQTLVNAFTSACSIHLIVSQLKDMFGIPLKPRPHDYFKIGFTIYDISKRIPETNYMALVISIGSLSILIVYYETLKPWLAKKCKMPVPIELLVVIVATVASYFLDLRGKFNLSLIGTIPTGLPAPVIPRFELLPKIAFDCLPIALVSYIVTMSLGFIFGRKGSYEVSPNQELLALGLMNLLGSFFQCIVVSGSLSRSIVQYNVGGVSQLALLVSAFLILFILLYIGPLLEYLPKCVLAGIIIATIYSMLCQIRDLKTFWLLSKWDAMIWLVTFVATLLLNIKYGLLSGMTAAVMVICYHFCKPSSYVLGVVPGTEIYMAGQRYKNVQETEGIKIFRFEGGINFASKNLFKEHLWAKTGINAKQIIVTRKRKFRKLKEGESLEPLELPVKCIILDFSAITHVDPAGVECLRNIESDNNKIGVTVLLCCASGDICEKLENYDYVEKKGHCFTMFVSIHDAVMYAKQNVL